MFKFYVFFGVVFIFFYGFEVEVVKRVILWLYFERIKVFKNFSEIMLFVVFVGENEIFYNDLNIFERRMDRNLFFEEKEKLKIKYKIFIKDFLNLWGSFLKEVYIRNGYVYFRWEIVLKMWEKVFEKRFERVVNIFYEYRDEFLEFYYRFREKFEEIVEEYFKERGEMFKGIVLLLRFDFFFLCVKEVFKGVFVGMRNYVIIVFLMSFFSYVRICFNLFKKDVRIKDCINDFKIIEEEILLVIIEVGNCCKLLFFED